MKNSMKLVYFNVAVLATLSLTTHVIAMDLDKEAPQQRAQAKPKTSTPIGQANEHSNASKEPKQDEKGQDRTGQDRTGRPKLLYTEAFKRLPTYREISSSSTSSSSSNSTSSSSNNETSGKEEVMRKQPNSKSAQSSQRKRFDPPDALSHEELKDIFEAPFRSTAALLAIYAPRVEERDNLRGKTYMDRKRALNIPDHDFSAMKGAGDNSDRVFLEEKSVFASLKETMIGRDRVRGLMGNGRFMAALQAVETRSGSTMGDGYVGIFGVYELYKTTGEPVTYLDEFSQEERRIKFRIAFSQEKASKEE